MTDANSSARSAALKSVPIEIKVCVGRARPSLGEMMQMEPEAILPLDRRVEDLVELYVGDKMIAEAELIDLDEGKDGRMAVRITRLAEDGHGAD